MPHWGGLQEVELIRSSLGAIAALALAAVVGVVLLLAQPGAVEA